MTNHYIGGPFATPQDEIEQTIDELADIFGEAFAEKFADEIANRNQAPSKRAIDDYQFIEEVKAKPMYGVDMLIILAFTLGVIGGGLLGMLIAIRMGL